MENISVGAAREFWRDLMGTLWKDPDCKVTHGKMGVGLIADYMNMPIERTEAFLRRCTDDDLRLTERQGGGWVV